MLTAINQTQDPRQLRALADAYKAVADKLPPRDAGEALKPVLTAINQTQDPDQLSALADAYKAVADKLPPAEAHAGEALKPVLTAINQTQDPDQLSALADAYKAVADKLPASSLRPNAKLLRDARQLALDRETWLKVATAELLVLPDLALDDAERLTADLLQDPLCIGNGREAVLNAFARRLDAQPDKKSHQPWGNDIWTFVAWVKNERGGFDF